jgi:hypothetical protein
MSDSSPLVLELSVPLGPAPAAGRLPLRVTFRNVSGQPVRMLAETRPLPVFFSFDIVDSAGTPVPVAGAGKIDFGPSGPRFVDIAPDRTREVDLDLGSLAGDWAPGRYRIVVTYHNQYGEGAFQGRLTSNPVDLIVGGV